MRRSRDPLRIVVSGMLAGVPGQGGASWAALQWILGLRRLGHDVLFVEPIDGCAGPAALRSARWFSSIVAEHGLADDAALLLRGSPEAVGVEAGALRRRAAGADVLINLSGVLRDEDLDVGAARRVYVDLDPVFTQVWHEADGIDMGLGGHDRYVTVGLNIGRPGCDVPDCGRRWIPTLPPVVLSWWPVVESRQDAPFTTVANWRGYGSVRWRGRTYGQKAHSFRRFVPLPQRTSARFEVAMALHPDEARDAAALGDAGWILRDPERVAGTPAAYRSFVQASAAEIGIAKSGYVDSRSGWFSDRSACYLASGRPVVAQDTGGTGLSAAAGLLTVGDLDEAAAAVDEVCGNRARHERGARKIAEDLLDSDLVLDSLLERMA